MPMTYSEFKTQIVEAIKEQLKERENDNNYIVEIFVIPDTENEEGLLIRSEIQETKPTAIILSKVFQTYIENPISLDAFAQALIYILIGHPAEAITKDYLKENVVLALINTDYYRDFMANMPHRVFHEFAVVCKYPVCHGEQQNENFVTQAILKDVGMTEEELFASASTNTLLNTVPQLVDVKESNIKIWALTVGNYKDGAICLYFDSVLTDVMEKIGEPFLIMPVCTDVVILIPESHGDARLLEMSMIQFTEEGSPIPKSKILGHKIYYFNGKLQALY